MYEELAEIEERLEDVEIDIRKFITVVGDNIEITPVAPL